MHKNITKDIIYYDEDGNPLYKDKYTDLSSIINLSTLNKHITNAIKYIQNSYGRIYYNNYISLDAEVIVPIEDII